MTDLASDLGRGVVPVIGGFANTLFTAFLGLVLAYWLARDYPKIHREIGLALGEEKDDDYRFIVAILSRSVGGYMRSMIITSVINGVLVFLGLTICHHPYAGLMGMLTALFHLIPVVGPVFSSAIAVVVAFFYGPVLAFWTLVITVVAQNITDNVISPKVMQSTVQVHPAMSLAAIVIGSALMGPLGMVVAIPLCAALKGLFIFYYEKSRSASLWITTVPSSRERRSAMKKGILFPPSMLWVMTSLYPSPRFLPKTWCPRQRPCLSRSSITPGKSFRAYSRVLPAYSACRLSRRMTRRARRRAERTPIIARTMQTTPRMMVARPNTWHTSSICYNRISM